MSRIYIIYYAMFVCVKKVNVSRFFIIYSDTVPPEPNTLLRYLLKLNLPLLPANSLLITKRPPVRREGSDPGKAGNMI